MIVAIVPAYNEAETIARTVEALGHQWAPPITRVIVVPNNCTDNTADEARSVGAEVWEFPGHNPHKKAGALNWALDILLPQLEDDDCILVTDADSILHKDWTQHAMRALHKANAKGKMCGAICANFCIKKPDGLLAKLQAAEYERFALQVVSKGKAMVLSGVATLFEVSALRHILEERGKSLPGYANEIYHRDPATEDIELTFAFWALGYEPLAPKGAVAYTDTMPTLTALKDQRIRWQRGMLDTLLLYKISPHSLREWARQAYIYLGSLATPLYLMFLVYAGLEYGTVPFDPRWLPLLLIFALERVLTVRRSRVLAATLILEWLYEQYRSAVYWVALWKTLRSAERVWINA